MASRSPGGNPSSPPGPGPESDPTISIAGEDLLLEAARATDADPEAQWRQQVETHFPGRLAVIMRIRELLGRRTRQADRAAMQFLRREGFLGEQAYERIHEKGDHAFSRLQPVPPPGFAMSHLGAPSFAAYYAQRTRMNGDAVVADFGAGFGRDAISLAKQGAGTVVAIEPSPTAHHTLRRYIDENQGQDEALRRIITVRQTVGDALHLIKHRRHPVEALNRLSHALFFSSIHYMPPELFKLIIRQLRGILERREGYLGVAIKTKESASADRARHVTLIDRPSSVFAGLHTQEQIFRLFPREQWVRQVIQAAHFSIEMMGSHEVPGYDQEGETEVFQYIMARAVDDEADDD